MTLQKHETTTILCCSHYFAIDIVNKGSLAKRTDLKDGAGEAWAGQFRLYEVSCSIEKYPR